MASDTHEPRVEPEGISKIREFMEERFLIEFDPLHRRPTAFGANPVAHPLVIRPQLFARLVALGVGDERNVVGVVGADGDFVFAVFNRADAPGDGARRRAILGIRSAPCCLPMRARTPV